MKHDYAKLAEEFRQTCFNSHYEKMGGEYRIPDGHDCYDLRAAAALAHAGEMEKALRAMVESVDKYVIATDDVDVRGAMCIARRALSPAEPGRETKR